MLYVENLKNVKTKTLFTMCGALIVAPNPIPWGEST